ncbi:hypothetical protein SAMN05445850_7580 [Paraburkholderia tuberum]|uniref:Uncharacterized protein n=1 Tax=Paraburkholderia tuberum TaxID=157910 RepID=A0A1H1KHA2_9BURK|nr:hypothetical protein SAMN05445850_7580 [Paraburkholderia tuberum]
MQASPAQADGYFQWQINSLGGGFTPYGPTDYLYGNGTPNKNVFMGQFEHFGQNRFGSNWIDFENYHGADMTRDLILHRGTLSPEHSSGTCEVEQCISKAGNRRCQVKP